MNIVLFTAPGGVMTTAAHKKSEEENGETRSQQQNHTPQQLEVLAKEAEFKNLEMVQVIVASEAKVRESCKERGWSEINKDRTDLNREFTGLVENNRPSHVRPKRGWVYPCYSDEDILMRIR